MSVYYRCLYCAPAKEWVDGYEAARDHMQMVHLRDESDAIVQLTRWLVTDADPGMQSTDGDDEQAVTGRFLWP